MLNEFSRLELLIGNDNIKKLSKSKVAIFGVGGVGGYTVEALARSGVGQLDLIDNDTVNITNINRQIIATHSSVGKFKVDVAKERILDINPNAVVNVFKMFYSLENADEFDFSKYDYIVDAIDTVVGKLEIIERAKKCNVAVISSMGAGNKMHPEMFEIVDISKTSVCPLAKVIRQELKKRNVKDVKVVYSKEIPIKPASSEEENLKKRLISGSNAFVPSAVGLIIAGEVIKDLIGY